MSTVHICFASSLPPDRVLRAAYDFTERRALIWPAVSVDRLTLHEIGENWADVTEGTRVGPVVNWERRRYDWSNRGCVTATVTDSNVYAVRSTNGQPIWRDRRDFVVGIGIADAAEDVREAVGGENQQHDEENDDQLGQTDPTHNLRSLGRPAGRRSIGVMAQEKGWR